MAARSGFAGCFLLPAFADRSCCGGCLLGALLEAPAFGDADPATVLAFAAAVATRRGKPVVPEIEIAVTQHPFGLFALVGRAQLERATAEYPEATKQVLAAASRWRGQILASWRGR